MEYYGKYLQTVNIFAASSGELHEERRELRDITNSVNKLFTHLKLDVKEWETDLESGSYQKKTIQDEINPLLEASQIVIVIFFSKIGKFTLEEYNLALEKKKKVFLYFKKGFSTDKIEENENYKKVLELREEIIKENKTLFKDYENIDQFINLVNTDLNRYLNKEYPASGEARISKYLTSTPAKTVDLVGRKKELKDIAHLLESSDRVLLVNGLGGVGKTELCKRYFWDNIDNYNHLAWVDVVGNTRESFVNAFQPEVIGGGEEDTIDERFERIIAFLNRLDKNSLLVVDNVENQKDKNLDKILRFPFKVVVSSRLQLEGFKKYDLDFLSIEACKELFYGFYKGKKDDKSLERIIQLAGSHTLTVELLARTAQNSAAPLEIFLKTLGEKGFNLNDVIPEKVETLWDKKGEREKFFNHLLKIFDLSNVTEDELHILANLSVLPPIYIPIPDVSEWLKLKTKEDINSLVFKGWLKQQGFNILMHQVIQEVTRYKTAPDVEKCKSLILTLTDKLAVEPGENPIDKKEYITFAETLLQHIDEKLEEMSDLSYNLAVIYRHMGSLEKALVYQLKALKIRENVLEENYLGLPQSYSSLALIFQDFGKLEKALEFHLKSLRICEGVFDKNHPSLATSYNNLSTIYQDLGQAEKALEFQLKALKIREEVLDKNHPDLAQSYNNLARIYQVLGQMGKALEFQLKAIKIGEEVLGKNHPDLAISYSNLSTIYRDSSQAKKAKEFQLKALKIREKFLDKEHPDLAISYNILSLIYLDLGKLDKSLDFQLKSLKINEKIFDENHPHLATSYNNLSTIYQALGQAGKALDFQLRASKIYEKVLDKKHPSLATSYENLALIYEDLNDHESACKYGEKAVAILQQCFPNGHPDLDLYIHNLEAIKKSIKGISS